MHRLYTTKYIYIISLISTIIIFLLICFFDMQIRNMKGQNLFEPKDLIKVQFENNKDINDIEKEDIQIEETKEENLWNLEIPTISLVANIQEGTSAKILNTSIGHFEETDKTEGNIGLAAHNRGDTDWTKLEETKENTITLITCVENEPEYRRCVIGKEKV